MNLFGCCTESAAVLMQGSFASCDYAMPDLATGLAAGTCLCSVRAAAGGAGPEASGAGQSAEREAAALRRPWPDAGAAVGDRLQDADIAAWAKPSAGDALRPQLCPAAGAGLFHCVLTRMLKKAICA